MVIHWYIPDGNEWIRSACGKVGAAVHIDIPQWIGCEGFWCLRCLFFKYLKRGRS